MRRIPYTLLVCLVLLMSTAWLAPIWAAQVVDSPDKILKEPQAGSTGTPADVKTKVVTKVKHRTRFYPICNYPYYNSGITKVKPTCTYPYYNSGITKVKPTCTYPYTTAPRYVSGAFPAMGIGRWEISGGVLFASLRGSIAWPRYAGAYGNYGGYYGNTNEANFSDALQLPGHLAVPTWSIKYMFRPNWAARYSGLAFEAKGGGQPSQYVMFGPNQQFYGIGQSVQSKYQHGYHRVGLVYDAIRRYGSTVRVFADWVHVDDRIELLASNYTGQVAVFSNGTDAAITGLELQKYVKSSANGATLSWDCRAGAIFLDDVQGVDAQAGAQYTIPLNAGRTGFVRAGYRIVQLQKAPSSFLLKDELQGGYMEMGFIF